MKLSKTELEVQTRLNEGYELSYDWISAKWSLQKLAENGMFLFIRVRKQTAKNCINLFFLEKLPYNGRQCDRYSFKT